MTQYVKHVWENYPKVNPSSVDVVVEGVMNAIEQGIYDNSERSILNKTDILSLQNRVTILEGTADKIFAVAFTGTDTIGVREGDAVGMVANCAVDDEVVVNDFDNTVIWDRPMCDVIFDANGNPEVVAYKGEPGYDATSPSGLICYEQVSFCWNESVMNPAISLSPKENTSWGNLKLYPEFDYVGQRKYYPVYFMNNADSKSGVMPANYSLNTAMTEARTFNANAHTETLSQRIMEWILMSIEFATRDHQTDIAMGFSSGAYSDSHVATATETAVNRIIVANATADAFVVGQSIAIGSARTNATISTTPRKVTDITVYDVDNKAIEFDGSAINVTTGNVVASRAWINGATDIITASVGTLGDKVSGKYPLIYRGKVSPYADGYSWLCDILIQRYGDGAGTPYSYVPFRINDPTNYNAGAITSDYTTLDFELATSDGYISALGANENYPHLLLQTAVGGNQNQNFSAYSQYPRYDVTAVPAGGNWNFGRTCSPLFFYCNFQPSNSHFTFLARLVVKIP